MCCLKLKGLHVGRRKVAGGLLLPWLGAICWQVRVSGQGMAQVIVIHAVIRSYGCSMVRPGTWEWARTGSSNGPLAPAWSQFYWRIEQEMLKQYLASFLAPMISSLSVHNLITHSVSLTEWNVTLQLTWASIKHDFWHLYVNIKLTLSIKHLH